MKRSLPIIIAIIIHVSAITLFLLMSGHFVYIINKNNKEDITSISIEGDPNKKIGIGGSINNSAHSGNKNNYIDKNMSIESVGTSGSEKTEGNGEGGGTGFGVKTNYAGMVIEKIHTHKHYPLYAQKRGITGVVALKFTLKKDGYLKGNIEMVRSSGNNILDEAGIKTIQKAAPFAPFPNDIKEQELVFKVDIDFVL